MHEKNCKIRESSAALPAHWWPTDGKSLRPLAANGQEEPTEFREFCSFLMDSHSDGEKLEVMCWNGSDFIFKFGFQFLFKQS